MTDETEVKCSGTLTITVGEEVRVIEVTNLDQLLKLLLGIKALAVGVEIEVSNFMQEVKG